MDVEAVDILDLGIFVDVVVAFGVSLLVMLLGWSNVWLYFLRVNIALYVAVFC